VISSPRREAISQNLVSVIGAVKVWCGESHCPFSLRLARRDFLSSQAALVEFDAIEAASLRKDAPWTDEHS
jgi:hypothetical protein